MSGVAAISRMPRCRLCTCILTDVDNVTARLCVDCSSRPEARRLSAVPSTPSTPPAPFTAAERALIRSVHSYMPVRELLRILNDRQAADLGDAAVPHTLEQLHAEAQGLVKDQVVSGDWAGLRRVLGHARRSGLLTAITPQLIEDFATVFQLAPAQLMHLRDVIRHARDETR